MNKTKEILFCFSQVKAGNGGVASAIEMALTLEQLKYSVTFIIYSYNFWSKMIPKRLVAKLSKSNIIIIKVPAFRTYLTIKNNKFPTPNYYYFSILSIRFLLKKTVYFLYSKRNKKFFKELSKFDILFFNEQLFAIELDCIRSKTNAILIQNHAGSPSDISNNLSRIHHSAKNYDDNISLYVNYYKLFDHVLFQSFDQSLIFSEEHNLLSKKSITLLPTCNETDINKAKSAENPFNHRKKIILNVGSIQFRKDQLSSILAFEKIGDISNVQLHFVGDYSNNKEYYQMLKRTIKSKGLESKIFFHGHRDDYLLFMTNADVLIQTSHSEGVSRVLREAMFMKLPIVSFAISGTTGILKKDNEAILVEERNINMLGVELESIIFNKEKNKFISSNAFKKYLMNHSNKAYSHNLSLLFKYILKSKEAYQD